MKKITSIILSVLFIVSVCSFTASAAEVSIEKQGKLVSETVEYFDDGSSVVTEIYEYDAPQGRSSTYSKTATKAKTIRNADGDVLWKFKVTGTFSVNDGVSATCTAASYSVSDLASSWSLKSATATRSGNKATANGTFQKKALFVVINTQDCSVTLQCDKNGNLS